MLKLQYFGYLTDTTQQLDNSKNNKEDLISSHMINQPRAGDTQRKAYGQILL